ncbi:hypothetical protein [Amycolatopsis sp. cmx-11-51]|uniref:hypothetical protein n=1 Tax=unclassified Amycolatopsis TaxID=2618356 RepID=UPI0039E235A4
MLYSTNVHSSGRASLQLDVLGPVLGPATVSLQKLIIGVIVSNVPETLVINLGRTTALSLAGVNTLLTGYTTAIDYGTNYRVLHAHGPVLDILHSTGTREVLADSNDLGALLLAALLSPVTVPPTAT